MATKTNFEINGRRYYRITRVIGKKDGRSVTKTFYGTSKTDAERKYQEYKDNLVREKYEHSVESDITLFSERAEEFIDNALKPSQKYTHGSKTRYISSYTSHIKGSSIDSMVASHIKARDIQSFYNELDVSIQTMRQIHKFMSAMYKWMVLNEYAPDVLRAVEIPVKKDNKRHEEIVIWSDEELETILGSIEGYRLRFLIYFLLYTGARIGEALAMKYSDIYNDTVHIRRQMYLGEIKDPKANSSRDIPMHDVLKKEYKMHMARHLAEMNKRGYKSEYIFTTNSGHLIETGNLRRSLVRYYNRIGVEPKHNHAYRSTFCTQLCRSGVPLEVASKLLGHKSIEVTARHYALVQTDRKKDAIEMLSYF